MQTVKTQRLDADAAGIARAAALLRAGRLVAFGTETVYGLGADAGNAGAIARLFQAKRRPAHNPLIAHFAAADDAFRQVWESPLARLLAERFWPGSLTLVLPRRPDATICAAAASGLASLAVRVPSGAPAQSLLQQAGRPVAAPSANPSGRLSPSTAAHVLDGLAGRIDAVLDCGPCRVGLESTVLDLTGDAPRLLRPGGAPVEAIDALLGEAGAPPLIQAGHEIQGQEAQGWDTQQRPASPGLLASHYAPALPVRLDASSAGPDEALLAFGEAPAGASLSWNLSPAGDVAEAATRLFAGLRFLDGEADRLGLVGIAVMPIPPHGLGLAIRDRLRRAAAPR